MPSVRRHIITGEEVLFAPERAGRPDAFASEGAGECPFCPGNESMTPAEIERLGDPWRVRVFPNKYPSVDGHEVIVESPEHDATFNGIDHAREAVETYARRYDAHSSAAYVSIFTNHGARAGASIAHLHSQLMALPFVPPRAARESAAFAQSGRCPLCIALDDHHRDDLVIDEKDGVVRIAPRASAYAYEQWIVPTVHAPDLKTADPGAIGGALQRAIAATSRVANAYNVLFMNFRHEAKAHFYIDVIPRLTALAGFELATGTLIDIIDPAAAARLLR